MSVDEFLSELFVDDTRTSCTHVYAKVVAATCLWAISPSGKKLKLGDLLDACEFKFMHTVGDTPVVCSFHQYHGNEFCIQIAPNTKLTDNDMDLFIDNLEVALRLGMRHCMRIQPVPCKWMKSIYNRIGLENIAKTFSLGTYNQIFGLEIAGDAKQPITKYTNELVSNDIVSKGVVAMSKFDTIESIAIDTICVYAIFELVRVLNIAS